MKLKKPNFWDYKKPNLFSFLLLPLTIPIFLKNFFTKSNGNKFEKIKTIVLEIFMSEELAKRLLQLN